MAKKRKYPEGAMKRTESDIPFIKRAIDKFKDLSMERRAAWTESRWKRYDDMGIFTDVEIDALKVFSPGSDMGRFIASTRRGIVNRIADTYYGDKLRTLRAARKSEMRARPDEAEVLREEFVRQERELKTSYRKEIVEWIAEHRGEVYGYNEDGWYDEHYPLIRNVADGEATLEDVINMLAEEYANAYEG